MTRAIQSLQQEGTLACMPEPRHTPVLFSECLRQLAPQPGETALDCTAGLGGHALEFARAIGSGGTLILSDLDPGNLVRAAVAIRAMPDPPHVVELQGNFADAPRRLVEAGIRVHVVLADLGFSSNQIEDAQRGLSFMRDGPLDMRLDPSGHVSAADLVNTLGDQELGEILREYGEEREWRRIAQRIIAERNTSPILTTGRLASIVHQVLGGKSHSSRIDPATRTFQALRIAVNDELGNLRALLESVARAAAMLRHKDGPASWLHRGARVGVISFHSLEDRIVKDVFGDLSGRGLARFVGRQPIEATDEEVGRNPRARSAKLRCVVLGVDKADVGARVV